MLFNFGLPLSQKTKDKRMMKENNNNINNKMKMKLRCTDVNKETTTGKVRGGALERERASCSLNI